MAKPLNVPDKWRAPIGAFAYAGIATAISAAVCFWLVYIFAIIPQNQAIEVAQKAAIQVQSQNVQLASQQKSLTAVINQLQQQAVLFSQQAIDRQSDTNAFAGAICTQRERALTAVRDPKTPPAARAASKKSADELWKFLRQLRPHPPTKCKGVDPYP